MDDFDRYAKRAHIIISEDYAVLVSRDYTFYYGYEVTDDEAAWCFKATIPHRGPMSPTEVIFTRDDLGSIREDDCAHNLLMGIAMFIDRYGVAEGLLGADGT